MGSSVPEWPVFSTRRIRLIQATTSCELGREGLSRHITPELRSAVKIESFFFTLHSLSTVVEEVSSHYS